VKIYQVNQSGGAAIEPQPILDAIEEAHHGV